jgi:aspartate/methionine/tyrosine aminotransferase
MWPIKLLMKKFKQPKNSIISERVQNIQYSTVRKSFAAGAAKKMINATIGRPDFDVPDEIKEQAKSYIDLGHNTYTETKGILLLREAISKHLLTRNIKRSSDDILVSSGTTSSIFMVIASLINPGDEVIIFEPYFVAYPEVVKMFGGTCVVLKTTNKFQPDIDLLEKSVTDKTKLIIVNSPNNPTGAVYSQDSIQSIVKIAQKTGVYILSDEIYHDFLYDKAIHYSPAEIYSKTVVIDGLSKSKGMSGWRMGFIAGPKQVIDAVEKVQQFTSVCAPAPFQYASVAAFTDPLSLNILAQYKEKRDLLINGIKDHYDVVVPKGAFYLFLRSPMDTTRFSEMLSKKGLAVVSGSAFGHYKEFTRISYALSNEEISQMINILLDVAKEK